MNPLFVRHPRDSSALNLSLRLPIDLLHLLDLFLPRLMFGKNSWSTPRSDCIPALQEDVDRGFNFLKRDLVRLLGILCFDNIVVQDRIRICGGVQVIMNMCVTDERNPCEYHLRLTRRSNSGEICSFNFYVFHCMAVQLISIGIQALTHCLQYSFTRAWTIHIAKSASWEQAESNPGAGP